MTDKEPTARTSGGQALFDVVVETGRVFFRMRAAGKKMGAITSWGGGSWGLMHSLRVEGPQTVPALARARPVARQRIQRLVNELAEAGLAETIDNPAHQRSKLVRLTAKGEAACDAVTGKIVDIADQFADDMDAKELRVAANVLAQLREKFGEL